MIVPTEQQLKALLAAVAHAHPTPTQSGFFVRGAALTQSGRVIAGGNHEYSKQRAVHCEETIVVRTIEECGVDDPIIAIGFASEVTPCGNCRDILRTYVSPDALVVWPTKEGFHSRPLWSFYNDEFVQARTTAVHGVREALAAYDNSLCAGEYAYGVALMKDNIAIATGSFEGNIAYHPRYPIANALTRLDAIAPDAVVIVARERKPYVPYLDRQHLYEFNQLLSKTPLPIYLVEVNATGVVEEAWSTDAMNWLPDAFYVHGLVGEHESARFRSRFE